MPTLTLVYDDAELDPRTVALRWSDPQTKSQFATTQRWAWEGGDAIVIVTGTLSNPGCHVVIRVGDRVSVLGVVSVKEAMKFMGLQPDTFTVS